MTKYAKGLCGIFILTCFSLGSAVAYSSGNGTAVSTIQPSVSLSSIILLAQSTATPITQLFFQLPNGRVVVTKPNHAPYCATKGTCDFPIDCYGNEKAPKQGFQWECKNEPGACVGKCYLTPITDKQDKAEEILATIVSGD